MSDKERSGIDYTSQFQWLGTVILDEVTKDTGLMVPTRPQVGRIAYPSPPVKLFVLRKGSIRVWFLGQLGRGG